MPFFGGKQKGGKQPAQELQDDDIDDMAIDDADLENDPELMKELLMMQQELSGGSKPKVAAPPAKPKPKVTEVDLASAHKMASGPDEIEVDLTEEDMNDPDLLSELSALTGGGPSKSQEVESDSESPVFEEPPAPKKAAAPTPAPAPKPTPAPQPSPPAQKKALPAEELVSIPVEKTAPPAKPAAQVTQPKAQSVPVPAPILEKTDLSIEQKLKSSNPALLEKYIQEEKAKALAAKKDGDTSGAVELMRGMKQLQTRLQELSNPAAAPAQKAAGKAPAATAPQPVKKTTLVTNTEIAGPSASAGVRNSDKSGDLSQGSSFGFLIKALEKQIEACNAAATRYSHAGDKETALAFQREKKNFEADLQALNGIQQAGGALPKFHSETKSYSFINQFTELQENELGLQVAKVFNIPIPQDYTSVDSYLNYEFGFPDDAPQTGSSSVVKNTTDPEFNYSVKLRIQRNKTLVRFFEKKKLTVELMHSKGFFRKATSLGKASIELAPLLTKCEIHEIVDLMNEKRKPTGAKIEVKIRLRFPLNAIEHVSLSEKWFYIDHFDGSTAQPQAKPQPESSSKPAAAKEAKPAAATPAAAPPPAAAPAKEVAKPAPAPAPAKDAAKPAPAVAAPAAAKPKAPEAAKVPAKAAPVEEDDEEDPDTVDSIVSFNVLEAEKTNAETKIVAFKAKGATPPEDLLDRLQAIDLKTNLLMLQVQTGQLSMEGYLDVIRKGITFEKERALKYKKDGKIDFAKIALGRMKIMQKELEEAESAAAE